MNSKKESCHKSGIGSVVLNATGKIDGNWVSRIQKHIEKFMNERKNTDTTVVILNIVSLSKL